MILNYIYNNIYTNSKEKEYIVSNSYVSTDDTRVSQIDTPNNKHDETRTEQQADMCREAYSEVKIV